MFCHHLKEKAFKGREEEAGQSHHTIVRDLSTVQTAAQVARRKQFAHCEANVGDEAQNELNRCAHTRIVSDGGLVPNTDALTRVMSMAL